MQHGELETHAQDTRHGVPITYSSYTQIHRNDLYNHIVDRIAFLILYIANYCIQTWNQDYRRRALYSLMYYTYI